MGLKKSEIESIRKEDIITAANKIIDEAIPDEIKNMLEMSVLYKKRNKYLVCWRKNDKVFYFLIKELLCTAYKIRNGCELENKKGTIGKTGFIYIRDNYPDIMIINVEEFETIDKELSTLFKLSDKEGVIREVITKARVNQSSFRNALLINYKHCCLCNVNTPDLLIASHIKPWSLSKPKERMDVENGFLMCPNHDKLFDKGWISFDESGKIMISKSLSEEVKKAMNVDDSMSIHLTDGNKKYLVCHRQEIFIDKE